MTSWYLSSLFKLAIELALIYFLIYFISFYFIDFNGMATLFRSTVLLANL